MKFSMYKTLALKYKSTLRKTFRKYDKNGKITVEYVTKAGKQYRTLYNEVFTRKTPYRICGILIDYHKSACISAG